MNQRMAASNVAPLSDERLDALAKSHTKVRHRQTHGWGVVPVSELDHRAFARAVLDAVGVNSDEGESHAKGDQ